MSYLAMLAETLVSTVRDILPIALIITFFQLFVLRRPMNNLAQLLWGFGFVVMGLALFLMGLELALFPLGEEMANQLTAGVSEKQVDPWYTYYWTYLFAFAIGLSTTIAEPALIAVAMKADEVSGGTIQSGWLRTAVALGVGIGVALGTFRIIVGVPLPYFILTGYAVVVVQTWFAPKQIIPIAYDSGGVTTSTVTVPLVAALGLGLASRVPGRDPIVDGFGLIAFASLFPMMTVMGYAQLATWIQTKQASQNRQPSPKN